MTEKKTIASFFVDGEVDEQRLRQWLIDNRYDGLYESLQPCGCGVDDFIPCTNIDIGTDCMPAYTVPCDCGGEHNDFFYPATGEWEVENGRREDD